MKSLVLFKKFYEFHAGGILNQDPRNKKDFDSFILISLKVKFDPYVLNLVRSDLQRLGKERIPSNFMNFGVKKFIVKKSPKNKNFDV
jgi:hypothetical protein